MFLSFCFKLILVVSLLQYVTSHKSFQQKIPNGASVPNPCRPGQIWQGVGHLLDAGTGPRNPFGLDFAATGYTWTEALCRKDSDGDGLTNGAELGDPDCLWKENNVSTNMSAISHPGICDPWDSPMCMQKPVTGGKYTTQWEWLQDMCKTDGFDCPALNETGVMNFTARMNFDTPVPAKVTTYECLIFDIYELGVPLGHDYHVVAVTPIIDNKDVVHHMILFGCTSDAKPVSQPFECGMVPSMACQEFLHVWTVGLDGECYHPQSGIRIGQTGYNILALQVHWNNYGQRADYVDSSGLSVHYTPNLRPYDAGVLMIGSILFQLPPKKHEVIIHSTCASQCTSKQMEGPMNVTSAWNHMHYAGRKMSIEITRNNEHVTYLTDDKTYSYDSPQVHLYPTPVVLMPGDELLSTCGFNTLDRNKTTFSGEATSDEMCLGFITYYPKQNMSDSYCLDKMEISRCNPESWEGCTNLEKFIGQINTTDVFQEVSMNCRSFTPCITECVDTLVTYMMTEPCMKGNIWEYIQAMLRYLPDGQNFLSRIASCKAEVYGILNPPHTLETTAAGTLATSTGGTMETSTVGTSKISIADTPKTWTEGTITTPTERVCGSNIGTTTTTSVAGMTMSLALVQMIY